MPLLAIALAGFTGIALGFFGCAILTSGALADARSTAGHYAARLQQFMLAYRSQDKLALIAAYNAAERALTPGETLP